MDDYWGSDQLLPFNFYDEQSASFGDYLTSPIIQHELKWPTSKMEKDRSIPVKNIPTSTVPKEERQMEGFQIQGITEIHIILFLVFIITVLSIAMVYTNNRHAEMMSILLATIKK